MTNWLNNDGLYIKYGPSQGVAGIGGFPATPSKGALTVVEVTLTLASLGSSSAIVDDVIIIPKNARIESVETVTVTAAAGSSSVLNVGLIRTDRSTSYDSDGFLQALAISSMDAANETNVFTVPGGAGAGGTLVGTTLTYPGLLVADYDTAAFSDGVLKIRISYSMVA